MSKFTLSGYLWLALILFEKRERHITTPSYLIKTHHFPSNSFTGLRDSETREERLRNIPSAYNYRLIPPVVNISTEEEAMDQFQAEFELFTSQHAKVQAASGINLKQKCSD